MALPIKYHLEVYQDSFLNDPVWSTEATIAFPAMAKGDSFNHRALDLAWDSLPAQGQEFVVSKIEHIYWQINGDHIGHKLMVIIKIENK